MSRTRAGWVLGAALGAVLGGCAGNAEPRAMPTSAWGEAGPDTVSGRVRQVGNLPFSRTLVDREQADAYFVSGELEREIGRLSGMEVRVSGAFTEGDQPGRYIRASSYEILGLPDGTVAVGVLGRDDAGFYVGLFDGGRYRLSQLPVELEEALGARVWVEAEAGGHVRGYGILRRAAE